MDYKLFTIILMLFLSGCLSCEEKELLRVTSPDSKLDAVYIRESCGGATEPYVYYIYIIPKGKNKNFKRKELVFQATDIQGEQIRWLDSQTVEIVYDKAQIYYFKNFINIDNKSTIEIREILMAPPSFEHRQSKI